MAIHFLKQFCGGSLVLSQHDATSKLEASWRRVESVVGGELSVLESMKAEQKAGFAPMYTVNAFSTDRKAIDLALQRYEQNRGVGVRKPVTPRFKENLVAIQNCFLDLDLRKEGAIDGEIDEKKAKVFKLLDDMEFSPSVVVFTKNGMQCLWKIEDEGCGAPTPDYLELYDSVERGIIEWSKTIGGYGDKVKDVTRIFRLPGFDHLKNPAEPYRVEAWPMTKQYSYTLEELYEWVKEYIPKKSAVEVVAFAPIEFEKKDSFDLAEALNASVDIRDATARAFAAAGARFEVERDGFRWIIDGRLTGNFFSKEGKNIACTTSGTEPFSGPPFAVIIQIFCAYGRSKRDALLFINDTWGHTLLKKSVDIKQERVAEKVAASITTNTQHVATECDLFIQEIMGRRYGDYFSWGMEEVDRRGGLLTLGRMAIIGGQHSAGKTTYITELVKENSKVKKAMLIPLEMGSDYTMMMLAVNRFNEVKHDITTALSYGEVEEGFLYERHEADKELFVRCVKDIYSMYPNLYIRTPDALDFDTLKVFIQQYHEKEGIDFFVIDHIHQLSPGKSESETEFYSMVAKELKELASRLNIALLVVVQLTKSANMKGADIDFSSFKGTSEFTSNAHRVVVIKRPAGDAPSESDVKRRLKDEYHRNPLPEEVAVKMSILAEEHMLKTRNIRELLFLKTRGRDGGVMTIEMNKGSFRFKNNGPFRAAIE